MNFNRKLETSLQKLGIERPISIFHNPSYDKLFELEMDPNLQGFEKAQLTDLGAVNVLTGKYTGRSPKDKYFVKDEVSEPTLWWRTETNGNDNRMINQDIWSHFQKIATQQLSEKKLFVIDAFCGANENSRLKVRIITEVAWQAHFVTNMFIRPTEEELVEFGEPDFTVINASKASNPDWKEQGLNSEIFNAFNLKEKIQIIGGTWYGGEMKKGMFGIMNYYLPKNEMASMHCSANVGEDGLVALFFGLSGTGKTTLSTDPNRALIGDDEHGWDDNGIFNFEGGSYAKTLNLSEDDEPEIYQAIRKDALLENVVVNENGKIDFTNAQHTQNTRVSYPLHHLDNIVKPISKAGHAKKIIFLTADAFGVMPPVAKLTKEQTMYHYLSGFTAKLAGTERGINQPVPTFSACFGEAFLTLHPTKYALELKNKIEQHDAQVYLVNTGWNGSGRRISIRDTRAIIDRILDGSVDRAEKQELPIFNLEIPLQLNGVSSEILDPRNTYADTDEWYEKAMRLGTLFIENFEKYTDTSLGEQLVEFGPTINSSIS